MTGTPLFDGYFDRVEERNAKRRATATLLGTPEPEAAAEGVQLGRELGVPARAVMGAPELFRSQAAQKRASTALTSAPKLSDWLGADPVNGALAKDDLDNLGWWERGLRAFGSTAEATALGRSVARGTGRLTAAPDSFAATTAATRAGDVGKTYDEILAEEVSGLGQGVTLEALPPASRVALMQTAQARYDAVAGQGAAQRIEYVRQGAEALARAGEILARAQAQSMSPAAESFRDGTLAAAENSLIGTLAAFSSDPIGGAAFIAETAAEFLPVIAAASATTIATRSPGAGAAVMGGGSFLAENTAAAHEFLMERGVDLSTPEAAALVLQDAELMREAAEFGATRGMVIAIFDAVSGGVAGQTLLKSPAGDMVAQGIAQAALGGGGEAAAQAATGEELDWREIVVEGLAELATAPIEVAGVGGRGLARMLEARAKAGEAAARIDAVDEMAAASKLKARDPEKFAEALEAAGRGDDLLYVPAEGLQEYFQAKDVALDDEILEAWGIDVLTFREQVLAGGDVAVPASAYAAHISGTEDASWFRDNARLDPNELSAAEAAEFNDRVRELAEEEFQRAEQQQRAEMGARASDVQVYDQVFSQLRAAGRTPDVAQREAAVWAAFWRTMGERYGADPLDLAQSMGVSIRGPQEPEQARLRNDLDIRLNTLRKQGEKALRPVGTSLLEFVREQGGVRDTGGDVEALDVPRGVIAETAAEVAERRAQPALAGMPSEGKGRGLDELGRAMIEAGYFPDLIGAPEVDEAAVALDAIQRAVSGEEIYLEGEGRDADMVALAEALSAAGVDLSTATNDEAAAALEGVEYGQAARTVEVDGIDLPLNADGTVTLYHGTSREAAERIVKAGELVSAGEPSVYLTTATDGTGYGDGTVVAIDVQPDLLRIDDEFPDGRADFAIDEPRVKISAARILGEGRELYQSSALTREDVDAFAKALKDELGLRDLSIFLSGDNLKLNMIAVDKDKHGRGTGSEAMRRIVEFADQHQKTIALTPGLPDDGFGTTSRARLVKFYKRFGFVENKGRNKDFSISEGMYREPQRTLSQDKGDKRGSIQLPRGGLKDGETVISLFEAADLSTFLHESGHFFLEAFSILAADDNAPQAMRDDMAAIRKFLKVKEGQPFTVEQHETWARGFEAYLMEGKAPSLELADAFARFKAWLGRIYRSIKGLNVSITPEIREVMDRMLATDAEIAAMRDDLAMRPLFTEAGAAGMSDADFATYQRMARRGVEQAEASLMKRTMAKVRRETEAWFKAERKAVTKTVTEEINRQPVYRLTEMLANQAWLGDTDKEVPDMRIDRAALVEQFGEGVLAEIGRTRVGGKRAIYAKDGTAPDVVADMFGFPSASAMIEALQNAPRRKDAIAQEVERRLVEMHGDPLNDGTIEEAAAQAVHSEQQRQAQILEARTIARQLGRPVRDMKAAVYRARAKRMIGRMTVREAMRPAGFLAAERKAAREAQRAFAQVARGTGRAEAALAQAMEAKERQILNGYLYNEAKAFEARLGKQRAKMMDYRKKSVRAKLAGGYIEQIDALLERFDFRQRSQRSIARSESLRGFIARMQAEGREAELSIDPRLEDEARRVHYTRLSVDELNGLFDTIANIDHMGRFKQKLIDAKEARELEEVARGVAAAVEENLSGAAPNRTPTASETRRKTGRDYLNLVLNADTLLREADGFEDMGFAWSALKAPVDAGMARLTERRLQMAKDFDAVYSRYSAKEQRDMAVKKDMPALGGTFSKWDLIAVALNTGNALNYERLTNPKTEGRFTPAQVEIALAQLDSRDWETAQQIIDLIGAYWPEIEAKEKRLTGTAPPKVEAQSMSPSAPASFRGGYYPIKYDARLSGLASDLDMKELADSLMGGRFGKAQTANGHTKARAETVKMPLLLDLSVAHSHVAQVLYDLEIGEPVANSWRVLQQPQVKDAFKRQGRQSDFEALEIWLQDVASGDQVAARGLEKYMRHLRSGFVVSRLAVNISTALIQPSGLAQSAVVVGKRAMAEGTISYISNRRRWLKDVAAVSPLMRERQKTFERDIFNVVGDLEAGPVSGRWAKFHRDVVLPASFYLMQKVQFHAVDMPTWVAAYEKEVKASGDEARAVTYADAMVRRAQGSGLMSDRGMLERGTTDRNSRQREFPRMLTALGSYMFAKGNVAYERTLSTNFRSPAQAMMWAVDMALLFTLEAVLYAAVKGYLPDEEEDTAKWLLSETLYSMMSTLPGLREVSGALSGFGGGGIMGAVIEKAFAKPVQQVAQGEADKAALRALVDAAGIWLHLPSSQVNTVINAVLEDDLGPRRDPSLAEATGVGAGGQSVIEWMMQKD